MTGLMTIVCRASVKETTINGNIIKKYYITIGDSSNELSGTRVKLKETKIENSWENFKNNIIKKEGK